MNVKSWSPLLPALLPPGSDKGAARGGGGPLASCGRLQSGGGLLVPAGDDAHKVDDVLLPHDRCGGVRLEVGPCAACTPDAGLADRGAHVRVEAFEELG